VSLARYSAIVVGTVLVSLAALRAPHATETWNAVAAAAALAGLNAVMAFALVAWSSKRPNVTFFRAILGGTLARMALLVGGTVAAILWLGLGRVPFVLSLISYFAAFLALELAVVHYMRTASAETSR
jgi:uncharacterized membrane protein